MNDENMNDADWRKEITNLTDEELDDELQRPTGNYRDDVQREALMRLLEKANL